MEVPVDDDLVGVCPVPRTVEAIEVPPAPTLTLLLPGDSNPVPIVPCGYPKPKSNSISGSATGAGAGAGPVDGDPGAGAGPVDGDPGQAPPAFGVKLALKVAGTLNLISCPSRLELAKIMTNAITANIMIHTRFILL